MGKVLTILEVSQKQAYIFASNKLQDNIINSEVIAHVLSSEYLQKVLEKTEYCTEKNMVFSGGGHTVLEFDTSEQAQKIVSVLTETVYRDFDGLGLFVKTIEYNEERTPKENIKQLIKELEKKKSLREHSFSHGSYGIEEIDANTLDVLSVAAESKEKQWIRKNELDRERMYYPEDFSPALAFGDLGGSKNESNFIAVVHIDGNGMGKRVEAIYDSLNNLSWDEVKSTLSRFSSEIDAHFNEALKETAQYLGEAILNGELSELSLKKDKNGKNYFPLRRLITAGDDICFVTEGRIGIECAAYFIRKLADKINSVDKKNYIASAGVAIVHQKYPFYRAYELSEMLCSNAKKFGSRISPEDNGSSIGAIDWHIEFGELKDTMEEIRASYVTEDDGYEMILRPYVVKAPQNCMIDGIPAENSIRGYNAFKNRTNSIQVYPRGKLKELRNALRMGAEETKRYILFNRMEDILSETGCAPKFDNLDNLISGNKIAQSLFREQKEDRKTHCVIFDSIEIIDTYLPVGKEK